MKVIAATKNPGKIREIMEILSPLGIEAVSHKEMPALMLISKKPDLHLRKIR